MHNITLVSTRHENIGKCNSQELWQILETIKPEVIFQEIPSSYLNKHYIEQTRSNLETDAIRLYIEAHKPTIVAVDIDDIPDQTFFKEHKRLAAASVSLVARVQVAIRQSRTMPIITNIV